MKNKVYIPEKRAGIWLDHQHAYVFRSDENYQYEMQTLQSEEANGHSSKKGVVFSRLFSKDRKQRREHQQLLRFFENISSQVKDCDYVYVFGPGSSKHAFNQFIKNAKTKYQFRIMAVDTADRMSVPQMLETVKGFFRSIRFEDALRMILSRS
jgi:stalled ribosome rescue protein Dom34